MHRWQMVCAGLFGATGVILAAIAAHLDGGNFMHASQMLLLHAPVLLVLGLLTAPRVLHLVAAVLALGVALFAGDLVAGELLGDRLLPMAAPVGGMLMIGGWLLFGAAGLFRKG